MPSHRMPSPTTGLTPNPIRLPNCLPALGRNITRQSHHREAAPGPIAPRNDTLMLHKTRTTDFRYQRRATVTTETHPSLHKAMILTEAMAIASLYPLPWTRALQPLRHLAQHLTVWETLRRNRIKTTSVYLGLVRKRRTPNLLRHILLSKTRGGNRRLTTTRRQSNRR